MTENQIQKHLSELFQSHFGRLPDAIQPLSKTASGRRYFRLQHGEKSYIGTYGNQVEENDSFIYLTEHFNKTGMPVPKILSVSKDRLFYIQNDLGNQSLMQFNHASRTENDEFSIALKNQYKKTLEKLALLQIEGGKGIDYSKLYQGPAFDKSAMMRDLNYFKFYFLHVSDVAYNEKKLEQDFETLCNYLLDTNTNFFLFRDFQSRNVMLKNGEAFFMDYQGGRQGALQYDLASVLFQSKARIPQDIRKELLEHYIQSAKSYININDVEFKQRFYGYVLIRLIQVLGAYGFRGLIQRMPYFIQSIPLGLKNLQWWLDNTELPIEINYLRDILGKLCVSETFKTSEFDKEKAKKFKVIITSFSYKEGLPKEDYPNGGGFIFDCRSIHNPGRYEPYKTQTGRDQAVIDFLLSQSDILWFLDQAYSLVDYAVETSLKMNYQKLSVHFGCTGGQHRSVYSADAMAKHLSEKYGLDIQLNHTVQERKNWVNERY